MINSGSALKMLVGIRLLLMQTEYLNFLLVLMRILTRLGGELLEEVPCPQSMKLSRKSAAKKLEEG